MLFIHNNVADMEGNKTKQKLVYEYPVSLLW